MERVRMYLVGTVVDDTDPKRIRWSLKGLYSTEELAEKACTSVDDFVRPVWVNETLPAIGTRPCPIYFPMNED